MKKIRNLILMLTLTALIFALVGCSSSSRSSSSGDSSDTASGDSAGDTATSDSNFPEKEITIVTWSSVGGGGDLVSRKFVEIVKQDADLLSVNLNVENITGANCIAACESVKAADPDGYTLLFVTANLSTIPWSTDRDDLNYADSFKAVISFSTEPLLLTIRADDERFSDFESFVAYAQEHPGEVTIAGGGTTESVVVESMANVIGIDLDLVMYDGGSEMAAALAGGHIDAMFGSPSDVISYVEAGQLANIAVISDERYEEDFPDVPTPSEFGYDVVSADQWRGLVVPKDTPDDVVEQLYEIFYNITQTDEFADFLELNCMTPSYMNPEEFDAFLLEQDELYKEYFSSLEE